MTGLPYCAAAALGVPDTPYRYLLASMSLPPAASHR